MQKMALRMPKGPDFGAPARLAICRGNPPFVSGIAAHAREGKTVGVGDAGAQTRQALDNLKALVEAAGGTPDDVVKLTVFARNIADRPKVNRITGGILPRTISAGDPGGGEGSRRGGPARGNLKQGGAA